jgi:cell division transport system permease protein
MSEQAGKSGFKKKSSPSFFYSVISITLVLFLLGILGTIMLFSHKISKYFRENIEITIILKDGLNQPDVFAFQKTLDRKPFVKSTEYLSKDDAAGIMKKQFGEDLEVLGYNPLYASINMYLKAEYATEDSLKTIEKELLNNKMVQEVYYMRALINLVNKNIRKISLTLGGLALLVFFISLTLIDSTIKLLMYSQRFLIRSMQLVGATRWFIIKPYILRSIANGAASGLVAVIAIIGLLYYVQSRVPNLIEPEDLPYFIGIFIGVVLTGIMISLVSTYFAVGKYLRLKLDDLY